ncbi:MAG: hypothetical protein QMD97_01020 [Candidatus Aenigmarchaeota archaeon]|nr:hypothetical protein [Candidatus Aenigmarchaeota archaeon]
MTLETILIKTFPEKIDVYHYDDKIKGQELLLEKADKTSERTQKDCAFC